MRDYADQINSIRLCAENDDPVDECCWEDCNQHRGSRDNMCRQKIMMDAADAIKELLAAVPKWISVEERLPEAWKPVLAFDPTGYGEIGIAFIVGSLNTVVWRGVGFTNTAYPPNVTHWMPLPEPPMEVE